ncbi:phosphate ABC transporter membrane protein 2, PhoT family (TC 3.A.1.7.1) [Desulfonauticus submarinus]|uniref:Phosphate transport system permease protein PstA n=1 Tax=Desulfonauticus submarinus TaxID=206665 RepID=A0A1H0ESH0_9BACT|nr:phosphate ABC transporter permease PstA [Desulfonauticus submarinus]SDN85253.1 phosphate ABC transporter membrane protein 2, PhoT family (TC 3.A.1.7.1) [Desulfonauticus submarinus]
MHSKKITQGFCFGLLRCAAFVNALALGILIYFLIINGISAISWEFLTQPPKNMMTQGGIMPCIIGTFLLSFGAMLVALPLGIGSAIYLNEYARPGRLLRLIRLGINNLAGVPSIVFGLFGLAFFATQLKFKVSLLTGMFTLGFLTLPVVISATEEALKAVPSTYREASLGLGATKWQTIYKVVLPAALPGILTGAILSLSRAAGETAAIMYSAAVFYSPKLISSILEPVMALPYHIYVLATAGTEIEKTRPLQYGTALVLITLIFGMNFIAIYYRAKMQKKY